MLIKAIKQIKTSEQGSLLLMSMLILSGIVTAAGTFGIVTLQNLQQAVSLDQSAVSFYAAESGVEDSLYEIRKKETAVAALPATGSLSNSATWARTVTAADASLQKTLVQNDVWEVNLFDPDNSLSPLAVGIKSVSLAWTGGGNEWLEVEVVPWGTEGNLLTTSQQLFSAASNPAVVNLQDAAGVLYRLRLKALYGDLNNLTITAWPNLNVGGGAVNIPTQVTITATGTYNRVKQALRAIMAHRAPLSGVFGYVIFTEDDLIKP